MSACNMKCHETGWSSNKNPFAKPVQGVGSVQQFMHLCLIFLWPHFWNRIRHRNVTELSAIRCSGSDRETTRGPNVGWKTMKKWLNGTWRVVNFKVIFFEVKFLHTDASEIIEMTCSFTWVPHPSTVDSGDWWDFELNWWYLSWWPVPGGITPSLYIYSYTIFIMDKHVFCFHVIHSVCVCVCVSRSRPFQ